MWTSGHLSHLTMSMTRCQQSSLALTFHQLPVSDSLSSVHQPSLLKVRAACLPLTIGKLCH